MRAARRLTREDRKSQTRDRILEAARDLFLRQGFHATSLEQIAAEAGFTKGAVFSNFEGKADLFLALIDERTSERIGAMDNALARRSRTMEEEARSAARAYMRTAHRPPEWSVLLTEFWAHACRDPNLRRQLAARHERVLTAIAESIEAVVARQGRQLTLPTRLMAQATWSIAQGAVLEQLVMGDGSSDQVVEVVWDALFQRFTVPLGGPGEEEER
jgi:AcrR family transcriptional regulator